MNSTPDPAESGEELDAPEAVGEDAPEVLPDPALLEAHDLALSALREITPEATIGDPAGYRA